MSRRRRFLVGFGLIFFCLCLAGAERGGRWLRSRYGLPTQGAQWIWVADAARAAKPVAVWAVRDVDVGDRRPAYARLLITADEEYLAWVNGRLVGAGTYVARAPMDELILDGVLDAGWNRVVIELRSVRGAGGLLASLEVGDAAQQGQRSQVLRTDENWRIYRERREGLLEGWSAADGGKPPVVWQVPPTGRWPAPAEVQEVPPLYERLGTARSAARIVSLHAPCAPSCTGGQGEAGGEEEGGEEPLDTAFLIDFAEAGVGFLELDMKAPAEHSYQVRLGDRLADLYGERALLLSSIPFAGSSVWRASHALPFRYALVQGVESVSAARFLPVHEEWQSWEVARRGEAETLLGIQPRSR